MTRSMVRFREWAYLFYLFFLTEAIFFCLHGSLFDWEYMPGLGHVPFAVHELLQAGR